MLTFRDFVVSPQDHGKKHDSDSLDLRLAIERRKKDPKRDGGKSSAGSHTPSHELSPERSSKLKKSKYVSLEPLLLIFAYLRDDALKLIPCSDFNSVLSVYNMCVQLNCDHVPAIFVTLTLSQTRRDINPQLSVLL